LAVIRGSGESNEARDSLLRELHPSVAGAGEIVCDEAQ
jgi:hypothetical protein